MKVSKIQRTKGSIKKRKEKELGPKVPFVLNN